MSSGVDRDGMDALHASAGPFETHEGVDLAYRVPPPVRRAGFDAARLIAWPSIMAVTWDFAARGVFVQCHPETGLGRAPRRSRVS